MSLLLGELTWLDLVYIIYTTGSRTYRVAGVTISGIHCLAYGKDVMELFCVKAWLLMF